MIKIGDFVTCYCKGYWQLVDLKPKIAEEDYFGENISYKKGDLIGEWAILKKAFTPKMKPRIDFEYEDASWMRPVSKEVLAEINQYFAENPSYKEKFDNAKIKLRPTVTNCWISIPPDKEEDFVEFLKSLPARFTKEEFYKLAKPYAPYIGIPPSSHLLNLLAYPWDLTEQADLIYHGFELLCSDE